MKKVALAVVLLLTLSGCGSTVARFQLKIDTNEPSKRPELVSASKRVFERRLKAMGENAENIDVKTSGGNIEMSADVAAPVVRDTLTEQLAEPFSLRIMSQAPDGKGDITVEGHGSFKETGLTEKHLNWVSAGKDTDPSKGRVVLDFTEEGRKLMADVFRKNKGKYIGLFVRKRLVSKLLVEATEVKDSIIITDIPSVTLAEVFADDINVGLHVIFTPVK